VSGLAELQAELRAEGGLIGAALAGATGSGPSLPAAGSLETAHGPDPTHGGRDFIVEAVREGYLLHYDEGRIVRPDADPDLALLAGDRLYALGLERLAQAGDLAAVVALAELIADCAVARAVGDRERAESAWRGFVPRRT
jgi:hypothetical protein